MKASEIKFKAWDVEDKRFIKKNHLLDPYNLPVSPTKFGFKLKSKFEFFQYSGVKDHARREVYDGDVIEVSLYPHLTKYVVCFASGSFVVVNQDYKEKVLNLNAAMGEWGRMDASATVVGHIKNYKLPNLKVVNCL